MGTSEDLVPKGLPYGAREKTVAAMRSADVPVSSEGGGGSPPTAPATTPVARVLWS